MHHCITLGYVYSMTCGCCIQVQADICRYLCGAEETLVGRIIVGHVGAFRLIDPNYRLQSSEDTLAFIIIHRDQDNNKNT